MALLLVLGTVAKAVGSLLPQVGRVPREMDDALRRRLWRAELMMKLSIAADSGAAVAGLVVALNPDDPPGKRVFGGFFAALALAIMAQLLWLLWRTRAQRRRIHHGGGEG